MVAVQISYFFFFAAFFAFFFVAIFLFSLFHRFDGCVRQSPIALLKILSH